MAVFIGVIVILTCIAFVVLMMVSEWKEAPSGQPLAENPAAAPVKAAARKAAPKKKAAAKAKKKKK